MHLSNCLYFDVRSEMCQVWNNLNNANFLIHEAGEKAFKPFGGIGWIEY